MSAAPIPLYVQIASALESRIHSGTYAPGSLLGTEKELAQEFGVSRITVQHALDALSRNGLIDRQRARGTFVSPSVRPRGQVELHGFLDDVLLMGELGETREVSLSEVAAPPEVARKLELPVRERVVRVRRLRSNNGVNSTWIVDYLPLDVGRRFSRAQLSTHSIIQLIDQQPDLALERGAQLISAIAANKEIAAKLAVPLGTPILLVERTLQTAHERSVAYSRFHYLGHPQWVRVSRAGR